MKKRKKIREKGREEEIRGGNKISEPSTSHMTNDDIIVMSFPWLHDR